VTEAIADARLGVITMENHSIVGGLGSAVAELMAESGAGTRLLRIGIQDRYSHGASRHTLMKENALDALSLVRGVERLTDSDLAITEDDLAAVRIDAVHSEAKAEAL
jgi:transketolase